MLLLATLSTHSLVAVNVVVSAVAIAIGSLIVASPDRAARIWGGQRFANSTPERRDVLVGWYRILGGPRPFASAKYRGMRTVNTKVRVAKFEQDPSQRSLRVPKPFAARNSSGLLNTFRNSGVPEKDSGLTGPIVIKEYCRLCASKAECGSRKSWYKSNAVLEEPTRTCLINSDACFLFVFSAKLGHIEW